MEDSGEMARIFPELKSLIPEKLFEDEDFLLDLVKLDSNIYKDIEKHFQKENFWGSEYYFSRLLERLPVFSEDIEARLSDPAAVMELMAGKSSLIKRLESYIDPELFKNKEKFLKALPSNNDYCQDLLAFCCNKLEKGYLRDKDFVFKACTKNTGFFDTLCQEDKLDIALISDTEYLAKHLEGLKQSDRIYMGRDYSYLLRKLKGLGSLDKELIKTLVTANCELFESLDESLKTDSNFILELTKASPEILTSVDKGLFTDAFKAKAIKKNPLAYAYFDLKWQLGNPYTDNDTACELLKSKGLRYMILFDRSLLEDKDLIANIFDEFIVKARELQISPELKESACENFKSINALEAITRGLDNDKFLNILSSRLQLDKNPSSILNQSITLHTNAQMDHNMAFDGNASKFLNSKNASQQFYIMDFLEHDTAFVDLFTRLAKLLPQNNNRIRNWIISAHGYANGMSLGLGKDEQFYLDLSDSKEFNDLIPLLQACFDQKVALVLDSCSTAGQIVSDQGQEQLNIAMALAVLMHKVINQKSPPGIDKKVEEVTLYAATDLGTPSLDFMKYKLDEEGAILDARMNVFNEKARLESTSTSLKGILQDAQRASLKFVINKNGIKCYSRMDSLEGDGGAWLEIANPEPLKNYQ